MTDNFPPDQEVPPTDINTAIMDLVKNTVLYGTGFMQMRRTEQGRIQVRVLRPEEYMDPSMLALPEQKGESDDH